MSFGWVGQVISNELRKGWHAVTHAGKLYYEYFGLCMVVSAFWYGFAFLPVNFFIEYARIIPHPAVFFVLYLVAALWAGPVTASTYAAIDALRQGEGFLIRDLFLRIPHYFKRSSGTMLIALAIFAVLIIDVLFFFQSPYTILRWLTILWVYLIAFWLFGLQYLFPFLVQQSAGVLKTLQRAALVALDNVIVSGMLAIVGVIVYVISIITAVPMVLAFMGFMAAVHNYALVEILKKYDDPLPDSAEDANNEA